MSISPTARDILDFWFGDAVDGDEQALQAAFKRWFGGGESFDEQIRKRFGDEVETALAGGFADWENDIHDRLALILLLDQFPRNIFRRTARAFAGDAHALELSQAAVASGEDHALTPVERVFLLMPYQHAEDLDVQREGVKLFGELAEEPAPPALRKLLESSLDYARKHCEIIAAFGRFPYRNGVLKRSSTAAEETWLTDSSQRFGQ